MLIIPKIRRVSTNEITISMTLSQYAEQLINVSVPGKLVKFSLEDRSAFRTIYDSDLKNIVIAAGRQVGKSTFLGNRMLIRSAIIPYLLSLYVTPTHMQTAKFSNDRLRQPLLLSPDLLTLKGSMTSDSILCKRFANGSEITLRYAYYTADRIRGVPAHELYIDEFQDLVVDVIPEIEQCLFNAPEDMRTKIYCGTFKTLQNPLTHLVYDNSYLFEWVVPCRKHPFTYWNILGVDNISDIGLVCNKCKNPINANDPESKWVRTDSHSKPKLFTAFRLPQIAVPCDWKDLSWNLRRYSTAKFFNECLALPYEHGLKALTQAQLQSVCEPDFYLHDTRTKGTRDFSHFKTLAQSCGSYAGVDWGTGTTSYTVVAIATYGYSQNFYYYYLKRYEGIESDPEFIIPDLLRLFSELNVRLVGCDYGYGFGLNSRLQREFSPSKVHIFEYVESKEKAVYDLTAKRFKINRTEVLTDFFSAIKRQEFFRFPRWEDFYDPFGKNFLAVFLEENRSLTKLTYQHAVTEPDDAVHACLYAFLVSCLEKPHPQFFWPVNVQPS